MYRQKQVMVAVGISLLLICGCIRNPEDTFTNGGVTLRTNVVTTSTDETVTVTDSHGAVVLTLVITLTGMTMSAPGEVDATMTFRQPLIILPTPYTARAMAIFAAGPRALGASLSVRPDSPGCDWFPDYQCTLGCCADHDQCYSANSCGASSWIWGFGTDECKNCNNIAYDCIAAACAGVTESFTENNCYDAKCNEHYDCPPDYNSCTCVDICAGSDVPASCGNGKCEVGEDLSNCYSDCGLGTSESECCAAHSFPYETGSSCGDPGISQCCCGSYYACGWHVGPGEVQNVCVHSYD